MDNETIELKKKSRREAVERIRQQQLAAQELMLAPYVQAVAAKGELAQKAQFFHQQQYRSPGGRTIAVVAPEGDVLRAAALKLLGGAKEVGVEVHLGISQVNTDAGDTYNRKVGRIVATSKLQPTIMKLRGVDVYEDVQHFKLILGELNVQFSTEKNPNVPRLAGVWKSVADDLF